MRIAPAIKAVRVLKNLADRFGYPACVLGGDQKMHLVACNDELSAFVGVGEDQLVGTHVSELMNHFLRIAPPELQPELKRRHEELIDQGNVGKLLHVQSWFVVDHRKTTDATIPRDQFFILVLASRYPFKKDGRADFLSLVQFIPRRYEAESLSALIRVFDHAGGYPCATMSDQRILDWFGTKISQRDLSNLRLFHEIGLLDEPAVMSEGRAIGFRKLEATCTALQNEKIISSDFRASASNIRKTIKECERLFSKFPEEAWHEIDSDCRQFRIHAKHGRHDFWTAFARLAFRYTRTYFRMRS
jgi:hypothetical protein